MTEKKEEKRQWNFTLPLEEDSRLISKRKKSPQSGDEGISVSFRQQVTPRSLQVGVKHADSQATKAARDSEHKQALADRLEVLRGVSRESKLIGPFTPRPGGEKLHVLQVFGRKDSGN